MSKFDSWYYWSKLGRINGFKKIGLKRRRKSLHWRNLVIETQKLNSFGLLQQSSSVTNISIFFSFPAHVGDLGPLPIWKLSNLFWSVLLLTRYVVVSKFFISRISFSNFIILSKMSICRFSVVWLRLLRIRWCDLTMVFHLYCKLSVF